MGATFDYVDPLFSKHTLSQCYQLGWKESMPQYFIYLFYTRGIDKWGRSGTHVKQVLGIHYHYHYTLRFSHTACHHGAWVSWGLNLWRHKECLNNTLYRQSVTPLQACFSIVSKLKKSWNPFYVGASSAETVTSHLLNLNLLNLVCKGRSWKIH